MKKFRVRLAHWLSHNEEHGGEYRQAADQARALDLPEVAQALDRAGDLAHQAGEQLRAALKALEGS